VEINKIAIIGLGLIGGSLAKAIKKANPKIEISALDRENVLAQAFEDGVICKKLNSIDEVNEVEVIFICLPVNDSLRVFQQILPILKTNQILTDTCSIKGTFAEVWKQSNSKGIYIGGHPMTGKEKSGYENSDSLLFENSIYILTDGDNSPDSVKKFIALIESIGAHVAFLNADIHDVIVAEVSHLPQLIATSLVNTISQHKDLNSLSFAAGGFRDMTRIASSPFNVWEPILKQNKEKILAALDSFRTELEKIQTLISKDEFTQLAERFESARIRRDVIPKNTKGFISQLYDIYVYVKDQPGEMSKISTALYENNINIKDIEVMKMREGAGGAFRFAFDTEKIAERAKKIIEGIGFSTKI
jgi:prephenate dehydrogenase